MTGQIYQTHAPVVTSKARTKKPALAVPTDWRNPFGAVVLERDSGLASRLEVEPHLTEGRGDSVTARRPRRIPSQVRAL